MNTETAANPADEGEATPIVDAAPVTEAETPAVGDTSTEAKPEEGSEIDGLDGLIDANPEPEFVEVEIDGKSYKVQADAKDFLLREADYRRKTMSVAEERRALEAAKQEIAQARAIDEAEFKAHVQLAQYGEQLAQYDALTEADWREMYETDDVAAREHERRYEKARREVDRIGAALREHNTQKQLRASQEIEGRHSQVLAQVSREIPGFTPELQDKLESFAGQYGYTKDAIRASAEPHDYKLLHLAYVGSQVIEQRRKAEKLKAAAAATPAHQVSGGGASGSTDPSRMSMDEYIAARKAGKI